MSRGMRIGYLLARKLHLFALIIVFRRSKNKSCGNKTFFLMVIFFSKIEKFKVSPGFITGNPISTGIPLKKVRKVIL